MTDDDIRCFLDKLPFIAGLGVSYVGSDEAGRTVLDMRSTDSLAASKGLFPASMVGAVGDVAAVCACLKAAPAGWAAATLDFTVKLTNPPAGASLRAYGQALRPGKTLSTALADICVFPEPAGRGEPAHCGTLLATTRNYPVP